MDCSNGLCHGIIPNDDRILQMLVTGPPRELATRQMSWLTLKQSQDVALVLFLIICILVAIICGGCPRPHAPLHGPTEVRPVYKYNLTYQSFDYLQWYKYFLIELCKYVNKQPTES